MMLIMLWRRADDAMQDEARRDHAYGDGGARSRAGTRTVRTLHAHRLLSSVFSLSSLSSHRIKRELVKKNVCNSVWWALAGENERIGSKTKQREKEKEQAPTLAPEPQSLRAPTVTCQTSSPHNRLPVKRRRSDARLLLCQPRPCASITSRRDGGLRSSR
ncbi:hypothetical protein SCHPADRAFT_102940 [Schizopora paradoxa]|uniref:Uncharacterized protein n=1 Tax=Schizopora paradoxa TaxID=27342 RepID=A0A0H2S4F9_9AGAM|nr:hypothetical protein SCHPADRAFT_102940 [Schizopora paradoxa]